MDQLRFRLPPALPDWPAVMRRLEQLHYRAAIVGPHGSGKTTFLLQLEQHITATDGAVLRLFGNRDQRGGLWRQWREQLRWADRRSLVLADGYDVLGPWQRASLRRATRDFAGLLVTAHRPCRLPTLLRTQVDCGLLRELVDDLLGPTPQVQRPDDAQLEQLIAECGGNAREVWRRLYLRVR